GRVRRLGPQISDLGTGALSRAARGGHREGARAQSSARFPDGGARCARSTGMMGGDDTGHSGVVGGPAPHIPVLGRRVVEALQPRDGGVYVDGTFGAGGHTRLLLAAADCRVIATDRDMN